MNEILEKIKDFADKAHGDQLRKYTPDRYIVHPIRVMETLKKYTNDTSILAAALLHDVLEDTPVTKGELKTFLLSVLTPQQTEKTINLVLDLTDVYTNNDFPYLNRKARKAKELERLKHTRPESQTIKYADILDNSIDIKKNDPHFAPVYLNEVKQVLEQLNRGNAELYQSVFTTVDSLLKQR